MTNNKEDQTRAVALWIKHHFFEILIPVFVIFFIACYFSIIKPEKEYDHMLSKIEEKYQGTAIETTYTTNNKNGIKRFLVLISSSDKPVTKGYSVFVKNSKVIKDRKLSEKEAITLMLEHNKKEQKSF